MAAFAKINSENIVEIIVSVVNEVIKDSNGIEQEQLGIDFLNNLYKTNDNWKQTSYNTYGGIHKFGGTPFRKNHANIGFIYDESKDAFISPKPFNSWTLNEQTCLWEAPISYPETYILNLKTQDNTPVKDPYHWDENTLNWVLLDNI
jgi:hypothetical protein